jgi:hypothetical protein
LGTREKKRHEEASTLSISISWDVETCTASFCPGCDPCSKAVKKGWKAVRSLQQMIPFLERPRSIHAQRALLAQTGDEGDTSGKVVS